MEKINSNESGNERNPRREKSIFYFRALTILDSNRVSFGTNEQLTQDGFLALAAAGPDTWNAWRKHHNIQRIDFEGVDFREKSIDFSGFDFQNKEEGHSCATFKRSTFGKNTKFINAVFGSRAQFTNAIFSEEARFDFAEFNGTLSPFFDGCKFLGDAHFLYSKFHHGIYCNSSIFHRHASFYGAIFLHSMQFEETRFLQSVDFSIDNVTSNKNEKNLIYMISFSGGEFLGKANFDGRTFQCRTQFGATINPFSGEQEYPPAIFHESPTFHGCKFSQNTNFDEVEFLSPASPEAARAYRTLKLAMEQLKATREEQRFFRLEMKAEHPSLPRGNRWISTLYSLFSDYGFSLWRPAAWLLALSLAFGTGYGLLANACAGNTGCIDIKAATDANAVSGPDRTSAVIKYTLGSVSPVPGLDKMQTELRAPLFGHQGWISIAALVLEILHKITTLVMTFLFALALRNLFKMKS